MVFHVGTDLEKWNHFWCLIKRIPRSSYLNNRLNVYQLKCWWFYYSSNWLSEGLTNQRVFARNFFMVPIIFSCEQVIYLILAWSNIINNYDSKTPQGCIVFTTSIRLTRPFVKDCSKSDSFTLSVFKQIKIALKIYLLMTMKKYFHICYKLKIE